jgi:hypothetical protein
MAPQNMPGPDLAGFRTCRNKGRPFGKTAISPVVVSLTGLWTKRLAREEAGQHIEKQLSTMSRLTMFMRLAPGSCDSGSRIMRQAVD